LIGAIEANNVLNMVMHNSPPKNMYKVKCRATWVPEINEFSK
jgi:hypothetical protein